MGVDDAEYGTGGGLVIGTGATSKAVVYFDFSTVSGDIVLASVMRRSAVVVVVVEVVGMR